MQRRHLSHLLPHQGHTQLFTTSMGALRVQFPMVLTILELR